MKLSDKELIRRFCREAADQGLAEELWRRHEQTIYQNLEKSCRTLCPSFYDPRDIVHDIYTDKARKRLLGGICEFRELDSARSFQSWLGRIARSMVLDERREILETRIQPGRRRIFVRIEKSPEEESEGRGPSGVTEESLLELPEVTPELMAETEETVITSMAGSVSFDEPSEPRSHHVWFRSRYSTRLLDPSAPVEWNLTDLQRESILRQILTRHAEQSDEDATCAAMIRLRYWRKWPVAKLVERFYGTPLTEQQRAARHRAYYRLLHKDYEGIKVELERTFGAVRPEQI
jgi:DNA-directed RNA polymerase specialized sigma24 family protein